MYFATSQARAKLYSSHVELRRADCASVPLLSFASTIVLKPLLLPLMSFLRMVSLMAFSVLESTKSGKILTSLGTVVCVVISVRSSHSSHASLTPCVGRASLSRLWRRWRARRATRNMIGAKKRVIERPRMRPNAMGSIALFSYHRAWLDLHWCCRCVSESMYLYIWATSRMVVVCQPSLGEQKLNTHLNQTVQHCDRHIPKLFAHSMGDPVLLRTRRLSFLLASMSSCDGAFALGGRSPSSRMLPSASTTVITTSSQKESFGYMHDDCQRSS